MGRLLIIIVFALCVGGCASSGRIGDLPVVAASGSPSQLVLIRTSSLVGVANSYYVALDGKDVFSIRSGEYTQFPISAGEHFVAVKCFGGWSPIWKEDSKKFIASPNESSYFAISPNMSCAAIEQVTADTAKINISTSKFVGPDTVSSK